MSVTWDQPDADPLADVMAMVRAMRAHAHETPLYLEVSQMLYDVLGEEGVQRVEGGMTEELNWPFKVIVRNGRA